MTRAPRFHTVLETPIGPVAVAWSERGLAGVHLPERDAKRTAETLAARALSRPGTPPPAMGRTLEAIQALARGEPAEIDGIELDEEGVPPFHRAVYRALSRVPRGSTCSYGELARLAGRPLAARAVGSAMRRNPWPLIVPCHRVLASGDRLGGFSAAGGVELKARLLAAEARSPSSRSPGARATSSRARSARDAAPVRAAARATPTGEREAPAAARDYDPRQALAHLRDADPRLGALIDRVPFTLTPPARSTTFEALLRTIVYQQLNGKAAATIHGRVLALFPGGRPQARALLEVSPERLREAGLSRAKTAAVQDLAVRSARGELPEFAELKRLDDETIVERLTVVRGIGRWSVEMLLLFWLRRPDVLPVGDFGVREGFRVLYGRREQPSPDALERHARRWRPYRSVASWYLWRAVDEAREGRLAPAAR